MKDANMRRLVVLVAVVLVVLGVSAVSADKAMYVDLTGDLSTNPLSNVWQKDLVSGETSLLISHESVPKDFGTRIEEVTPSPDGGYLLIWAGDALDVTYKDGKTVRQYGPWMDTNGSVKTKEIDRSYWVWSFKNRTMRRLIGVSQGGDSVAWDPAKPRLMVAKYAEYSDDDKRLVKPGSLRSYDPATGKMTTLLTFRTRGEPTWTPAGGLQLAQSDLGGSIVDRIVRLDMKGKARVLTTGSKAAAKVCPCKGGAIIPSYLNGFIYLTTSRGTTRFQVDKDLGDSWTKVDFLFDKSKGRLAAFYSCSHGPGHLMKYERLWIIDTKTCKAHLQAKWDQQGMADMMHDMLAWTPEGDGLVFRETVFGNGINTCSLKNYVLTKQGVNVRMLIPDDKRRIWTDYVGD